MNPIEWLTQTLAVVAALAAAPLFLGWINQCRAWLQNRSAPSMLQPYRGFASSSTRTRCSPSGYRRCFGSHPTSSSAPW